uniref:Uncharacterized protein n=1 Tax=Anguilla anguilla TaxID=7936 RepID=A0A0E9Q5S3_ANGAN
MQVFYVSYGLTCINRDRIGLCNYKETVLFVCGENVGMGTLIVCALLQKGLQQ